MHLRSKGAFHELWEDTKKGRIYKKSIKTDKKKIRIYGISQNRKEENRPKGNGNEKERRGLLVYPEGRDGRQKSHTEIHYRTSF